MTWPLLPLAVGALLLGYLEWPSSTLSALLAPALGPANRSHLVKPLGLVTGGLGVAGLLLAGRRRASLAE